MLKIFISYIFLSVFILGYQTSIYAACTSSEIRDLKKQGKTKSQIKKICAAKDDDDDDDDDDVPSPKPRPNPSPQATSRCVTPMIACNTGQIAPVGTPCWCNTPMGPIRGYAQ